MAFSNLSDFKVWVTYPVSFDDKTPCLMLTSAVPSLRLTCKLQGLRGPKNVPGKTSHGVDANKQTGQHGLHNAPQLTNRDVLELVASCKKSKKKQKLIYLCLQNANFLPDTLSEQAFNKKVTGVINKFEKLQKKHNSRCRKDGILQNYEELKELLSAESKFLQTARLSKIQSDVQEAEFLVVSGGTETDTNFQGGTTSLIRQIPFAAPNLSTFSLSGKEANCPAGQNPSSSMSSSFLMTRPQVLSSRNQGTCDSPSTVDHSSLSCGLENVAVQTNGSSVCSSMPPPTSSLPPPSLSNMDSIPPQGTPLRATSSSRACQVNSPQIKTDSNAQRATRHIRKILFDATNDFEAKKMKMDVALEKLESQKTAAITERREMKQKLFEVRQSVKQLTQNVKRHDVLKTDAPRQEVQVNLEDFQQVVEEKEELQNRNIELQNNLIEEKQKRRSLQKKFSKQKKLVARQINIPIATKSSGAYTDNMTLLTAELSSYGVSQEAVGKVMQACVLNLTNTTMQSMVSPRTAGRMIRRAGILTDVQVAVELEANAERGVRVGMDTTTRRGTEHVSTVWGVRKEDGTVKHLQSRVKWLPNHTADEQSDHILREIQQGRELLEKLNLQSQQQMAVVNIVEFIGDHVNDKLHRNLEQHHMAQLHHLVESHEIDEPQRKTLSALYKSACQQHSLAKVSRSFFEGMQQKEPAGLAASFGRFGMNQKKGRTYEALSAKVIELASCQLSPDYANTSDFNWADVYRGWCTANDRRYRHIGFVNKNRHYRHEKEAFTILMSATDIIEFYESRRSTRDAGSEQTLRNKDQLVFEGLQSDEVRAQLTAADAMRFSVHGPFGVMIKHPETDVLTVGRYIRAAEEFLSNTATNHHAAMAVLGGVSKLCEHDFPTPADVNHPVGLGLFPDLEDKAVDYLQAGCKCAAAALKKISTEYFPGGQYYQPTHHMFQVLTGHEAHTDRNESNFGRLSQALRKEPTARLQTLSSKVAVRSNATIDAVRRCPQLSGVVGKTRKLERDESKQTKSMQLSDLARRNEPHLASLREQSARRFNSRQDRKGKILEEVQKTGEVNSHAALDKVLGAIKSNSKKLTTLKLHFQHKKMKYPEFAAENKNLFTFSREKRALSLQQLVSNMRNVIQQTSGSDEDNQTQVPENETDELVSVPDTDSNSDSSESNSTEEEDSDPEIDQVQFEDIHFVVADTIVVNFTDRWSWCGENNS